MLAEKQKKKEELKKELEALEKEGILLKENYIYYYSDGKTCDFNV